MPSTKCSIGTMRGGSCTILGSPSTRIASLSNASRLSCARALAIARHTLGVFFGSSNAWNSGRSASMSRCAYQTSSIDMPANPRIASRYERTARRTIDTRSLLE